MKPDPTAKQPRLCRTDIVEARKVLGREPKWPVGLVLGRRIYAELRAYGVRFPCPVSVDPLAHPQHEHWFYLEANFQPFTQHVQL